MAKISTDRVLKELKKRIVEDSARPKFEDDRFPAQDIFIKDKSRLKVALCTRRAGKSYGAGKYLIKTCLDEDNVKTLYIAKTRSSAENILWKDVLKTIVKRMNIDAEFLEGKLRVDFKNGSSIQLLGGDANESEKDKILGQKFKLVIIDEAEAYQHVDLRAIIYTTLQPAMMDLKGTICMIGMPNDQTTGIFYDITTKDGLDDTTKYGKKLWSLHKWNTLDNPFMRDIFIEEMKEEKEKNPYIENTASFKQSWLGQWVINTSSLVYRFNRDRNIFSGVLPSYKKGNWHYIMGMDLGFKDDTSFVVMAYHDHDRKLYIINAYKKPEMLFDEKARKIKHFCEKFPIERIIIDPANKDVVESLKARLSISIQSASKVDKMSHIGILNGDLELGNIVLGPNTEDIWDEASRLIKDKDGDEHGSFPNHCLDALLYGWRFCYQFLSKPIVKPPEPGTAEFYRKEIEEDEARLIARINLEEYEKKHGDLIPPLIDSDNWFSTFKD